MVEIGCIMTFSFQCYFSDIRTRNTGKKIFDKNSLSTKLFVSQSLLFRKILLFYVLVLHETFLFKRAGKKKAPLPEWPEGRKGLICFFYSQVVFFFSPNFFGQILCILLTWLLCRPFEAKVFRLFCIHLF